MIRQAESQGDTEMPLVVDTIELEPEEPPVAGMDRNMQVCILQVKADQGVVSTDAAPEQSQDYEMKVRRTFIEQ